VIEVPDDKAGTKVDCPYCGDVNTMPASAGAGTDPAARKHDRAAAAGFPPDSGPETQVMLVRPALVRSRPIRFILVLIIGLTGLVLGLIHLVSAQAVPLWVAVMAALVFVACAGAMAWWWIQSLSAALEVTNKRTVARRGLLSRSTSEVVHDNIRNVQIEQSFWQRVWNVGSIGISSSGQDGIEIQMEHVPQPRRVKEIIDLYRPLD